MRFVWQEHGPATIQLAISKQKAQGAHAARPCVTILREVSFNELTPAAGRCSSHCVCPSEDKERRREIRKDDRVQWTEQDLGGSGSGLAVTCWDEATTKTLYQNSRCPGRDSNRVSPKHKWELLPLSQLGQHHFFCHFKNKFRTVIQNLNTHTETLTQLAMANY